MFSGGIERDQWHEMGYRKRKISERLLEIKAVVASEAATGGIL